MEGVSGISLRCRIEPRLVRRTSTTFLRLALSAVILSASTAHLGAPGNPAPGATSVTGDQRRAATYLEQAIDSYRTGRFEQSGFYLQAARRLDPDGMARAAAAHRVEAFLQLADNQAGRAAPALLRSVQLKPDPFLFYLLGAFNLELRSLRQARNAYRSAVLSHNRMFTRGPGQPEGRPLARFMPFACPTAAEESEYLGAQRRNSFASAAEAGLLWDRVLHPAELALASYQWLTLTRHLERKNPAAIGEAERALTEHLPGLNTLPTVPGNSPVPLLAVVRSPGDRAALGGCLRELARLELELKRQISLGGTVPAQELLHKVHELQRRVYRNAVGNLGELRDYYMYGTHALRHGHEVEALHALRRALALAQLRPGPAGIEGDIRQASMVYRALELTYRKLNRPKDAELVAKLARHIESHLAHAGTGEGKEPAQRLQLLLLRTSRTLLLNREGLALLMEHARNTDDGAGLNYYAERLKRRDRKYEYTEMLAAFPDL